MKLDVNEHSIIALDFETTGLNPRDCKVLICGISDAETYNEVYTEQANVQSCIDAADIIFMWNMKYDLEVGKRWGLEFDYKKVHDGMLLHKHVDNRLTSYKLFDIAGHYLGAESAPEAETLEAKYKGRPQDAWYGGDRELVEKYCLEDCQNTVVLSMWAWNKIKATPQWNAYMLDHDFTVECILKVESEPIIIYTNEYKRKKKIYSKALQKIKRRLALEKSGEFNWFGSSYGYYLSLRVDRTLLPETTTGYSTSHSTLIRLRSKHWTVKWVLSGRDLRSRLSGVANKLSRVSELYPDYFVSSAKTRRTTCSCKGMKMNLQGISGEMRSGFVSPKGFQWWKIDLTQIEDVKHMQFTEDHERIERYKSNKDYSAYLDIGGQIEGVPVDRYHKDYGKWKRAKLGANYGMGFKKYADTYGEDLDETKELFANFHRAFPAIREGIDRMQSILRSQGQITDELGNIYYGEPREAYLLVAHYIQGFTTGAYLKHIALKIQRHIDKWKWPDRMTLFVHDEINFYIQKKQPTPAYAFDYCNRDPNQIGYNPWPEQRMRKYAQLAVEDSHLFGGIPLRCKMYKCEPSWADEEFVETITTGEN